MDTLRFQVQEIAAHCYVEGTSCQVEIGSIRPPMEPNAANYGLLDRINQIAEKLGMKPFTPMVSGGGSDAAYTTRMGIPTVCSIGPCGWDVHTIHERSDVSTLPVRAKLVATCVCEL